MNMQAPMLMLLYAVNMKFQSLSVSVEIIMPYHIHEDGAHNTIVLI